MIDFWQWANKMVKKMPSNVGVMLLRQLGWQ